ncbi:MAG: DUF3143 domain-containing protein [Synechococcaceae cyanobacterium]|nr:DUF3143 domain-containing protein [Synechococcaceae cyanobacterium]
MVSLPSSDTPLYSHPLPLLEQWLCQLGAVAVPGRPEDWTLEQAAWSASIRFEREDLRVAWDHRGVRRVRQFPYGLSRADVEAAILAGP